MRPVHDPTGLLEFERLIPDSVRVAMSAADPAQFLHWVMKSLKGYSTPHSPLRANDTLARALAFAWARAVWNGLPMNATGERPARMPEPDTQAQCPCGSGWSFAQCCSYVPRIPPLTQDILWPYVLANIPPATRERLLASNRPPRAALVEFAAYLLDLNRRAEVVAALEPQLTAPQACHDETAAVLLDLLCEAYGTSDRGARRKIRLLHATTERAPRSPLRSEAWQRLATIYMDRGENERAWRAFQQAQQDNPHADSLCVLEVELLVAERRLDEAKCRSTFWAAALKRAGAARDDPRLEFLQRVASDPVIALGEVAIEVQGAGRRLYQWLTSVAARPVASHDFRSGEGGPELCSPTGLAATEREWHRVFALGKPFSVQDQPFAGEDVWDPSTESRWCDFLESHPESFDSIDILDDLATAIGRHPQADAPGLDDLLLEPVLTRTEALVECACGHRTGHVTLPWVVARNRPALRGLVRAFQQKLALNSRDGAIRTAEKLLRLNPQDDHGLRFTVVNEYLRDGLDRQALDLAQRYPRDIAPETRFGAVLALLRLKRMEDAAQVLQAARTDLPKTLKYLLPPRIRRPKLVQGSVRVGGDDQAWLYRNEMRPVWQKTPGALEWLREHG